MTILARRIPLRILVAFAVLSGLVVISQPAAANDTATRWEYFSESSACDGSYTRPPFASRSGWLSDSEQVLGPFGTYFGRTIGEVRANLVWWTVPFSSGRRVRVHRAALPAFQQVARNLTELGRQGLIYTVDSVGAFTPRTVGGEHQISRHAFGTAIDINPAQNPYRANGPLITDMPAWYVDAWKSAGFCWGGDWTGEKDAMHFSWIGPGTGFGDDLSPLPPKTTLQTYGTVGGAFPTVMAPVLDRYTMAIGASTANGGPNVAGIRAHPAGAVLDIASGYEAFGSCSVRRWFLEDGSLAGDDHLLLMDVDGDSRQDLVTLRGTGGGTEVQIATYESDFEEVATSQRSLGSVVAAAGADYDFDHISDLWITTDDGSLTVYQGPGFETVLSSETLPSGAPSALAVADRDGGDRPEVFALYGSVSATEIEVLRAGSGWQVEQRFPVASADVRSIGAIDFDGDGRADLLSLDASGVLQARMGNSSTGRPATSWFIDPQPSCEDMIPLDFEGRFFDDDGNTHVQGIEWIANAGITLGCNPPFNDAFCPEVKLTRAQAAAFVARALDLPESEKDYFSDDDGDSLEGPIDQLAAAGITKGCNPPANDRFCPDRDLTRGEFATFLSRAIEMTTTTTDFFGDDTGHTHEEAINRLAESGITKGCNPPVNDRFCPNRSLTRAEAASFFSRAFR